MQHRIAEPEETHFIAGLSEPQIHRLDTLGEHVVFEENELMVLAGEHSTMFYLLMSGSASVEMATDFCTISIQALTAGDAFGWSSLLRHPETMFQVRAREQSTALRLNGEDVTELCRIEPDLGVTLLRSILETVAGRVRGLEMRLAEFSGFKLEPSTRAT